MITSVAFALLFLIVAGFAISFIAIKLKLFKTKTSIQVMLLGIGIILVGGIMAIDTKASFAGFEYLVVFIGLCFVIGGFAKNNGA